MKRIVKEAFQSILESIVKDESIRQKYDSHAQYNQRATGYDSEKNKGDLTVFALMYLSNNHAFDNHPDEWGVSLDEAHNIRAYFQTNKPVEFLFELYSNFSDYFKGEYKKELEVRPEVIRKVNKRNNIPLSDYPVVSYFVKKIFGPKIPILEK